MKLGVADARLEASKAPAKPTNGLAPGLISRCNGATSFISLAASNLQQRQEQARPKDCLLPQLEEVESRLKSRHLTSTCRPFPVHLNLGLFWAEDAAFTIRTVPGFDHSIHSEVSPPALKVSAPVL